MDGVIENLNRYHINGLQFYDWANKHHQPLAGSVESPAFSWDDIADRTNYRNTVSGYISRAHDRNMTAMSYNLIYGADDDNGASVDGVQDEWYLYKDTFHGTKDRHDLPDGWLSDIYLLDPGNSAWRSYIAGKTEDAFQGFAFDGWQMDQLGERGAVYDYYGNPVDLSSELAPFVAAVKSNPNLAGTRAIVNAVNQYGQSNVATCRRRFSLHGSLEPQRTLQRSGLAHSGE